MSNHISPLQRVQFIVANDIYSVARISAYLGEEGLQQILMIFPSVLLLMLLFVLLLKNKIKNFVNLFPPMPVHLKLDKTENKRRSRKTKHRHTITSNRH